MTNTNPNMIFLSTKVIQREFFPMFSIRTVRNIIKKNIPQYKMGNKMLVRQSDLEKYISTLKDPCEAE